MKLAIITLLGVALLGVVKAQGNIPIGGPCTADDDCVGRPRSHCNVVLTLVCACNDNFVAKLDRMDCLPIVNDHEGTCSENQQCRMGDLGSYSECLEDKCVCSSGSVYLSGIKKCLPAANLIGDDCQENEQCSFNLGSEAQCDATEKCVCNPATSVPNGAGDECLAFISDFTTPCEEDIQCTAGTPGANSRCEGTCKCNDPTVEVPGINRCLPPAAMGQACYHDVQCEATVDLGELGACVKADPGDETGLCGCDPEGIEVGLKCLAVVDDLDGACEVDEQCQGGRPGEHSVCDSAAKVCKCNANSVPDSNVCYLKASAIGDACQIEGQCTPNLGAGSECKDDKCGCKSDHIGSGDNSRCLPKAQVGGDCVEMAQCPVNGICRILTGKCECNLEFVESGDKWSCLAYQHNLGGACVEAPQCQQARPGEHSDCLGADGSKVCECKPDAFNLPGTHVCRPKATKVGDPCVDSVHCEDVANTDCLQNRCECKSGFVGNPGDAGCTPAPRYSAHYRSI